MPLRVVSRSHSPTYMKTDWALLASSAHSKASLRLFMSVSPFDSNCQISVILAYKVINGDCVFESGVYSWWGVKYGTR